MKTIFENKTHIRDNSHDIKIVVNDKLENPFKMKMTYECYNAQERFTGDLFINGKWEHFFSTLDLGIIADKTNYVRSESHRENRCKDLQKLGINFYNSMLK